MDSIQKSLSSASLPAPSAATPLFRFDGDAAGRPTRERWPLFVKEHQPVQAAVCQGDYTSPRSSPPRCGILKFRRICVALPRSDPTVSRFSSPGFRTLRFLAGPRRIPTSRVVFVERNNEFESLELLGSFRIRGVVLVWVSVDFVSWWMEQGGCSKKRVQKFLCRVGILGEKG